MSPLLLAAGYVNVDVIATVERVPGFGERVTVANDDGSGPAKARRRAGDSQ